MKIDIVTFQPFPIGNAATNRIFLLAKSQMQAFNIVEIFILGPTEYGAIRNKKIKGQIEGINYYYTCYTTSLSSKKLKSRTIKKQLIKVKRILLRLIGIGAYFIKNIFKKNKADIILLYIEDSLFLFLSFYIYCKLFSIKLVTDIVEIPFFKKEKSILRKLNNFIISKCFDGLIVISQYLFDFYSKWSIPILKVPILVNFDEIEGQPKNFSNTPYIAYCGVLNEDKDGVFTLIKVFAELNLIQPSLKLVLIGESINTIDEDRLKRLIIKNNLFDKVILTGYIERVEMLRYLIDAKLLILIKPNNLQSKYCFPSKIGEYLATGNPILTTNIGEIRNYLINNENAFLVEPDNLDGLVERLLKVLSDDNLLDRIGKNGKETCKKYFNYKSYNKSINDFFEEL
jgi:glycosyltransferase involved in cell wall biosynthesis